MVKAKKKTSKPCGDKKDKKVAGFEEMEKLFKIPLQKFRVIHMDRPFPLDKDGSIKPMSGEEIIKHCQGYIGCGMLIRMQFALDPNKASYKRAPASKIAKIRPCAKGKK